MGNRGNIVFTTNNTEVGRFYSHWGRDSLLDVLVDALDSAYGRERWDDPNYLTAHIAKLMVADGSLSGICFAPMQDDGDDTYTVNLDKQTITDHEGCLWASYQEFIDGRS